MVVKRGHLLSLSALVLLPLLLALFSGNIVKAAAIEPEQCYLDNLDWRNPDPRYAKRIHCWQLILAKKTPEEQAQFLWKYLGIGGADKEDQFKSICASKLSAKEQACIKEDYCRLIHRDDLDISAIWTNNLPRPDQLDPEEAFFIGLKQGSTFFAFRFINSKIYVIHMDCIRAQRFTTKITTAICASLEHTKNNDDDKRIAYWDKQWDNEARDKSNQVKDILTNVSLACIRAGVCKPPVKDGDKIDCSKAVDMLKKNQPLRNPTTGDASGDARTPIKIDVDFDPDTNTKEDPLDKSCKQHAGIFAFMVCPGLNLLASMVDSITGLISDNIKWTILAQTDGSSSPSAVIQAVWQNILNIANIILAIAFMVMLYNYALNSQNTIKAYNTKSMLSRLIVVAIAMNLSFYACAALADISNLMGSGIFDLIMKQIKNPGAGPFSADGIAIGIGTIVGIVVLIIVAVLNFGIFIMIALMILIMITLRQVALVTLVIISPIAIACHLLPNTERWYQKWFNTYVQLLIIYPFFTAAWAGAHLVAYVMEPISGGWGFVIEPLCAVAPLAAILPIFKMSSGLMGKMASGLKRSASEHGLTDYAKNHDQNRRTLAKNIVQTKSINLQNKLGSRSILGRGIGAVIGSLNGTHFAAITKRSQDETDDLANKAVKDINKAKQDAEDNRADDRRKKKVKKENENTNAEATASDISLDIDDAQAAHIASVLGLPNLPFTINDKGQRVYHINGLMLIKYKAMTGTDQYGKNLSQTEYQSVLDYAQTNNILNHKELMETIYNVQTKGDTLVRKHFIDSYTKYDDSENYTSYANYVADNKTHIFMDKDTKKAFIEQTGTFSKDKIRSVTDVENAIRESRQTFTKKLDVATYDEIDIPVKTELLDNSVQDGDIASVNNIKNVNHKFIANYQVYSMITQPRILAEKARKAATDTSTTGKRTFGRRPFGNTTNTGNTSFGNTTGTGNTSFGRKPFSNTTSTSNTSFGNSTSNTANTNNTKKAGTDNKKSFSSVIGKTAIQTPHYSSTMTLLHAKNIEASINAWRKGKWDTKFKTW